MTASRILPLLPLALILCSCEQEPVQDASLEVMEAHREEMRKMREELEAVQEDLEARQDGWIKEREALEARLVEERRYQQAMTDYHEEWEANLEARGDEVDQREVVLAAWEDKLGEWEEEVAGQQALEEWIPEEPEEFQQPVADYDLFYDELDDYGSWYESEDYGYVYQPLIVVQDHGWRPYTRGRWVCTNYGWHWASDEPFGWACYHYGRWCRLPKRGWCWVPGRHWAPSWCAWREGNGHVGWAPLPPESMARRGWAWGRGTARNLGIHDECFNFVENRHMAGPAWRHCLPQGRNAYLRARTTCCTNIHHHGHRVIAGGPQWACIREAVGRPWPVRELEFDPVGGFTGERARHGFANGNGWRVFNPSLNDEPNSRLRPNRVAGRIGSSAERAGGEWAERFQATRRAQSERTKAWSEAMKDRLAENRQSMRQAQNAYQQRLVSLRHAVATRPAQARRPVGQVAVPRTQPSAQDTEQVAPARPRANMPSALGQLLPPGVVSLPEQGRTVEESIVARAERPETSRPNVSVVTELDPVAENPTRVAVIPQRPSARAPARQGPRVTPEVTESTDRTAVVGRQPALAVESPPRTSSRQEQMRETLRRQQEAMRARQQQAAAQLRQQQAAAQLRQQQAAAALRQRQAQARQTSAVPTQSQPRRTPTPQVSGGSQQGGGRGQVMSPGRSGASSPAASRPRPTPTMNRGRTPVRGGASPFQNPSGASPRRGR